MASQSAFQPVSYINLYAACETFCYSYSRALNMELKYKGIILTVACPGWIKTELLQIYISINISCILFEKMHTLFNILLR
ncbi:MAG: SDR family NAD(P)-dependent oxidoreductase [Agathobacter sp.]|nr:SDR family NAD(P)-dependent oxidoreductase [Agathobacter sp.]